MNSVIRAPQVITDTNLYRAKSVSIQVTNINNGMYNHVRGELSSVSVSLEAEPQL